MKWQSGFRGTKWASTSTKFACLHGDDGSVDVIGVVAAYVRHALMISGRHVYVFGFSASEVSERLAFGGSCDLVWDKGQVGAGDLSSPWGPQTEPIAFGVYVPSKANRDRGTGRLTARLRKGNVLRVPRFNSRGVSAHPTEKPVALMSMIVESSTCASDVVCDPFMGVGSTCVAAVLSGRHAVGVEIDRGYFDIAVQRCKAAEKLRKQMEDL